MAEHLGTDHRELHVGPKYVLSFIAKMPEMYDEPFADESSIPVHLLSRLAREKVTVALSGDGGDELLAGYTRYFYARDFIGKWLLREVFYCHVPKELIERPKQGFDVPVGSWLRGELRDWAEALLDPIKLRDDGFFDPAVIRRQWNEHLDGSGNWHYSLWDVLIFQVWHERAST